MAFTMLQRLESKERYLEDMLLRSHDRYEIEELKESLTRVRYQISKEKWKDSSGFYDR